MTKITVLIAICALALSCVDSTKSTVSTAKTASDSLLIGSWVEPIPGSDTTFQGMKLDTAGIASSINMATLLYESWSTDGDNLIVSGQSVGNGQTIEFSDTLSIKSISEDSLTLSRGEYSIVYTRCD